MTNFKSYLNQNGRFQADYEILRALGPSAKELGLELRRFHEAVKLYFKLHSDDALNWGAEITRFFDVDCTPNWAFLVTLTDQEMNDIYQAKVELEMDDIVKKAIKSYHKICD